MKFLGVMLDTEKLQLSLPEDKGVRLMEEVAEAQGKRVIQTELLWWSLIIVGSRQCGM